MLPRRTRDRLLDILEAIAKIEAYVQGMDRGAFTNDPRTVDAVTYNVQIIGEAASALETTLTDKYPEIPWINIVRMRHRLVHAYFSVALGIVWDTVSSDLAPLKTAVQRMLATLPTKE